ncbi:MAG: class I SAM-dependent methyltransferase [Phycisphaerales bacterium]|nr:class I SAM-dependent methyltransferase [Phycisphaerales bacterium]
MNEQDTEWMWNETRQVGTDYDVLAEVSAYDQRMARIRDVESENAGILRLLNLPPAADVLEIGCGTGRFIRAAAKAGLRTTAIDVSRIMLDYVQDMALREGLTDLHTHRCGFLTIPFPPDSFDAVVSELALHHLPDTWKLVALRNVARALKPGGQFLLRDVVFSVPDGEEPEQCLKHVLDAYPAMRAEVARHVATEFSTYSWIMEGLLRRAGFEILSATPAGESILVYHCRKR